MTNYERAVQILCEAYWGDMLKVYPDGDQYLFVIVDCGDLVAYAYGDWWQAWEISADAIIDAYFQCGVVGTLEPLISDLLISLLKGEDPVRLGGIAK